MNITKIEEAITLLYQTYIEDQDVATQRGIAITAMNGMVKLLGGADVVAKVEAVPYSARVRAQHLFEDEPQRPGAEPHKWVGLTRDDVEQLFWSWEQDIEYRIPLFEYRVIAASIEAKLKDKNTK